MNKYLESLKIIKIKCHPNSNTSPLVDSALENIEQAIERLNKYEQILGNGRLTDRNYKNTTLPLESCKPYLRLGQLEDIYEEGK